MNHLQGVRGEYPLSLDILKFLISNDAASNVVSTSLTYSKYSKRQFRQTSVEMNFPYRPFLQLYCEE